VYRESADSRPRVRNRVFLPLSARRVVLLVCFLTVAVGSFNVAAIAAERPSQGVTLQDVALSLRPLAAGFSMLQSFHFKANAIVQIYRDGQPPLSGGASLEYWAQGDLFRVSCRTDKELGATGDIDLSWNGNQSYLFLRAGDSLALGMTRKVWVPCAIPNPLLLVYHMLEAGSVSRLHRYNLATMDWLTNPSSWQALGAEIQQQGNLPGAAEWHIVTGMQKDAQAVDFRSDNSVGKVISRIEIQGNLTGEKSTPGDKTLIEVPEYSFFKLQGTTNIVALPRRVKVTLRHADGSIRDQLDYTLGEFNVNQPIPKSVFTLQPGKNTRVWDDDQKRFLKLP